MSGLHSTGNGRASDSVLSRLVVLRLPPGRVLDEEALSKFRPAPREREESRPSPIRHPIRRRRGNVRGGAEERSGGSDALTTVEIAGPSGDVAGFLADVVKGTDARVVDEEVLPARAAPDDLVYPDPGPLRRIDAPWDPVEPGQPGHPSSTADVVVAIIDSGVMTEHPDLQPRLRPGTSVIGGGVEDEDGHGTLLAGTILSATNHSPRVRLLPVKFIDGRTRPHAKHAAEALRWAMAQKPRPDIINLSWDLGVGSDELREAFGAAEKAKILVVVAAGNSGANNDAYPTFPACYGHHGCRAAAGGTFANVITVMATDRFDQKPGFSNYGAASVHLAAPGVGIVSTHPYFAAALAPGRARPYRRYDGTSAAAAYVTGAAALVKSLHTALNATDLKNRLISTADKLPDLRCEARGRLNLREALR